MDLQLIEQESLGMVDEHLDDWCLFAEEVLGVYLDDEQKAILRSVQVNPKTSVKSGTARGKDFICAVAAVCFFYLTPVWDEKGELIENTKVAMTAPTDRQVQNIMVPEITRLLNRARARGFNLPGRLTGYDIRTENKEWFLTGFKADDKATEAWTGFHAVRVMFVVTEASGIAENIFSAIEGNLQGESRLLIVFNDNTGAGYAASSQKKPGWAKFRLDSLNAPNVVQKRIVIPGQVDWNWVDNRVKDWCQVIAPDDYKEEEGDFWWENENGRHLYRPNDLFRVKIRGMAPKVSSGTLIPVEWVELANKRWLEFKTNKHQQAKALRLGVDVAGMGRDSSCWCHRLGSFVEKFEMKHSGGVADHMEIVGITQKKLQAATDKFTGTNGQAFLDTIGEGAGVFSRLNEIKSQDPEKYKWLICHSVKYSESPEYNGNELKDITGQYTFLNMRAYLFWAVRDWLNPINNTGAMLPDDAELTQEATEIQWKFRSDGSIQIEAKEDIKGRIGRSIDKFDALANTFYPAPDIDPRPHAKPNTANFFF